MTATELTPMTANEQLRLLDDRLREVERWSAEHDGRCSEKWESQGRHNDMCDEELKDLRAHLDNKFGQVFKKLGTLEVKVATFAALAGVVGAGAGTALAQLFVP